MVDTETSRLCLWLEEVGSVAKNGSRGAGGYDGHDGDYPEGYTGQYDAPYSDEYPAPNRSLIARDESSYLPARYAGQPDPFIIPGTGVSMGDPFTDLRLALEVDYFRITPTQYFVPVSLTFGIENTSARGPST